MLGTQRILHGIPRSSVGFPPIPAANLSGSFRPVAHTGGNPIGEVHGAIGPAAISGKARKVAARA